jgi:polyhydroxybutyrate depolymerase
MAALLLVVVLAGTSLRADEDDQAEESRRASIRARIRELIDGLSAPQSPRTDPFRGFPTSTGTINRSLEHNGLKRTYLLHSPPAKDSSGPLPLVIVLHGMATTGRVMQVITNFDALADEQQFLVAYPDGVGTIWNFWSDPDRPPLVENQVDDVGFIAALIDTLIEEKKVDPRRVYATGLSNGAFMANRLGCSLGDKIAAIAPIAGTLPELMANKQPARPVPVVYFHGTEDRIVGIDGEDMFTKSDLCMSAEELAAWWAKNNNCCPNEGTWEDLADNQADGTTVRRKTWNASSDGAPVVYYQIDGGGHTWPGGRFQPVGFLGRTTRDVDASRIIWEFFSKASLPAAPDGLTP